jgi:hypothetical protein
MLLWCASERRIEGIQADPIDRGILNAKDIRSDVISLVSEVQQAQRDRPTVLFIYISRHLRDDLRARLSS